MVYVQPPTLATLFQLCAPTPLLTTVKLDNACAPLAKLGVPTPTLVFKYLPAVLLTTTAETA